jgi:hypothetical protein
MILARHLPMSGPGRSRAADCCEAIGRKGQSGMSGEKKVAERVGFEPTRRLPAYGISNAAPSAGLGDLSGLLVRDWNDSGQATVSHGR